MPSRCTRDFEVFTGALRGVYIEGAIYPQDGLARKYPDAFEPVAADDSSPVPVEPGDAGGDD